MFSLQSNNTRIFLKSTFFAIRNIPGCYRHPPPQKNLVLEIKAALGWQSSSASYICPIACRCFQHSWNYFSIMSSYLSLIQFWLILSCGSKPTVSCRYSWSFDLFILSSLVVPSLYVLSSIIPHHMGTLLSYFHVSSKLIGFEFVSSWYSWLASCVPLVLAVFLPKVSHSMREILESFGFFFSVNIHILLSQINALKFYY